jgi:hypothetical protein
VVSVKAEAVQEKQLTIDAATSRHLMPLFLGSENMVVSVNDTGDAARDYTFSLQPNGLARQVSFVIAGPTIRRRDPPSAA